MTTKLNYKQPVLLLVIFTVLILCLINGHKNTNGVVALSSSFISNEDDSPSYTYSTASSVNEFLQGQQEFKTESSSCSKIPLVIFCDANIDDMMAFTYLFSDNNQKFDVKAISVDNTGFSNVKQGSENIRRLARFYGKTDIKIARGAQKTITNPSFFTQLSSSYRSSADTLWGNRDLIMPYKPIPEFPGDSLRMIRNELLYSPCRVRVLTLGTLTDLARFLRFYPGLAHSKMESVYMMGGAVDVPGNVHFFVPANKAAESNAYLDADAFNRVIRFPGLKRYLVSLTATNTVPLTPEFLKRLSEIETLAGTLTWSMLNAVRKSYGTKEFYKEFYVWDPITMATALDSEFCRSWDHYQMYVVTDPKRPSVFGATDYKRCSAFLPPPLVTASCNEIDESRFNSFFLDYLAHNQPDSPSNINSTKIM
eukprot:gb/GECH01014311.1/.p1 GENE.gb/GECH01014311.1/~~gb/GECH01014311.1/.p1  ORF type:complete len:423 (+),score=70.10 gb/GECH01014311.1/:1-1269(+)